MAKEQQKAFHHRATLKQKNKPFKRRFATKNSLRDKSKGRTQRASVKGKVLRKHSRADRRNAVRTEQRKKRDELVTSTRIFTGRHRAPKIVAVIPLCANTDTSRIVRSLFECVDETYDECAGATRVLNVARFKQSIQFVEVSRNVLDILDVAKVADYMVMGLSADEEVDAFGEHCLSAIQNQGHVGVFPVVQGLDLVAAKRRGDVRKSLQSFMTHFFPDADKVYAADSSTDLQSVLRMVTTQAPRGIRWRDTRPYMLAERVEFDASAADPQVGRLAITGYIRGANLSANRLIHIPSFGDFQIEHILAVPVAMEAAAGAAIEEDDEPVELDRADPALQDSLVAANEPDQLNNEQTWPEDAEMDAWKTQMAQMEQQEEEAERANGDRVVRVPKGMSAYQAAWIPEDDDEDEDSDSDSDMSDDDEDMDGEYSDAESMASDNAEQEYEDVNTAGATSVNGADDQDEDLLSAEEEAAHLKAYLKERERRNHDDAQFPDEVDTPMDRQARERFARFRGLQSFRTSPWDPYENLPLDFARIFQFENFKRTQQRVLRATQTAPARVGMRVRIVLQNVPRDVMAHAENAGSQRPFVMFALHQYEHQMSVVHFTVTRSADYEEPVRSKDPLVVHFGFRRYTVRPLFSQHLHGGATVNNVHKFERFLKPGEVSVGTIFAPIQFGTVPVSLYLPTSHDGALPTLVGTGSSLHANPSRILAKRVILTGAPFKIHTRGAVIRYMFFNSDDVNWFKPVQIYTKYGRVGHIRESLGTHGYMKCFFDGPIKQMDTVCMNLYKRVFPKWNTELWSEHNQTDEQKRQWIGPVVEPSVAMEI
ncbi:ribosome biogenesis protein tsr1 [Coemansia erecta]|nr:ribosome biogenesis protein tsr1 [Coemansia erecta]